MLFALPTVHITPTPDAICFTPLEKEAAEVLRINPGFTIESWKRLAPYKDPKDTEHRLDGLRKAGLPES